MRAKPCSFFVGYFRLDARREVSDCRQPSYRQPPDNLFLIESLSTQSFFGANFLPQPAPNTVWGRRVAGGRWSGCSGLDFGRAGVNATGCVVPESRLCVPPRCPEQSLVDWWCDFAFTPLIYFDLCLMKVFDGLHNLWLTYGCFLLRCGCHTV